MSVFPALNQRQLLTFLMFRCMKNRGYPDCMASMTRASPSSYPTLSAHLGRETETPRGFCEAPIVSESVMREGMLFFRGRRLGVVSSVEYGAEYEGVKMTRLGIDKIITGFSHR